MIGLGLVSFGREDYRKLWRASAEEHLEGVVDRFAYAYDVSPVGVAKNRVLRAMLDEGCDWLFVSEDDVLVLSPDAITGYVKACEESGYEHLMFHAHGPHNPRPVSVEGSITLGLTMSVPGASTAAAASKSAA